MPQLKNQIKNRDKNFEELFYTSPVAIYICDKDGYITFFNQASVDLWGRTPEIGKDLWCGSWKIYSPDGLPMPLSNCPMALTLKKGVSFEGEIIIERPDGSLKSVLAFPRPIFDDEDNLTGAYNTLVDITEQKKSEEKKGMLSAIVESSDDAIISKTLKGIITSWNIGAQKIFGYTEKEVIGKHISILIPERLLSEEEVIIHNIKSGNKIDHFRTMRLNKWGKEIPISLTVSPVKDQHGVITGASKIARDVSQQVEQERVIKQIALDNSKLFEEVKILSSKKDEFIALASHELKTPLTIVKGYLQVLQNNEKDNVSKLFLEKSLKQVERLNSLISDLFDISKIAAGKLQLDYETFGLRKLLLDIIETFHYSNGTHEIIFQNTGEEFIVEADKQRMEQVIINLLTNAIKYSPGADKVFVSIVNKGEEIIVKVKDEGIGLSAGQQEKMFTKFYRAEGNSNISGLGLGLYLTKEIIDRHSGKIAVNSELGKGSEFFFSIPSKIKPVK